MDEAQARSAGSKAVITVVSQQQDKPPSAREFEVYAVNSPDDRLVIVALKPKTEQGSGYLRIEQNLWSYDPQAGRWERHTERDRIAGTDSRREDFEASDLTIRYTASFEDEEQLGQIATYRIVLRAKPGADVAFPVKRIWIDERTGNAVKQLDYALSGRLIRSGFFPKWAKAYSASKKADVWYPVEARFDDSELHSQTYLTVKSMDLHEVDKNTFTKGWLESRSR